MGRGGKKLSSIRLCGGKRTRLYGGKKKKKEEEEKKEKKEKKTEKKEKEKEKKEKKEKEKKEKEKEEEKEEKKEKKNKKEDSGTLERSSNTAMASIGARRTTASSQYAAS